MNTPTANPAADDQPERVARWVYSPIGRAVAPLRTYWRKDVVSSVDHQAVVAKVATECPATPRYLLMIMMSAGIAILGLLLSSGAVVIGAMLLSPLMSPILGVGFALATGKQKWLKISARSVALGSVAAILFSALIVLVSPLETVTEEIAARTRPNLLDLLVALFSSIAGSYAMIRGREGTIVGVAIATALMPPLAVVGFGLATLNWTVFFGALGLFITNFLTIALTATLMARLYGFRTSLSTRQGWFQNVGIFVIFVAMAIPLGLTLRSIAFEANAQRIVASELASAFPEDAQIGTASINWESDPVQVSANVFTPDFRTGAEAEVTRRLGEKLGREVTVSIDLLRVGTDPGAAQQAELAQARAAEQAAATERQVAAMTDKMAVAAGVPREEVMLDRDMRRISASARPLSGLSLEGYRQLELRIVANTPGWSATLRPPALALPQVALGEDGPSAEGVAAERTILWAAKRIALPIVLVGPAQQTEALAQRLRDAGVEVAAVEPAAGSAIIAAWGDLPG